MRQLRLGQILLQEGLLTQAQLEEALAEQQRGGGKLGEVLVRRGVVTELQLTESLARQLHLPLVDLEALGPPTEDVLRHVPAPLAHALRVLPLAVRPEEQLLVVAVADALKGSHVEELRAATHLWVAPWLAGRGALERALLRCYGPPPADLPRTELAPAPVPPLGSERAMRAMVDLLVSKGLITREEFLARLRG